MIEDYKIKIEQKKNAQKKNNNPNTNINNKNNDKINEKNKLLRELEMWKKEYCDLFNRASKNTSLLSKNIKKPKLLSNNLIKKHYDNNINKIDDININLYKSTPSNEMKQIINRPQTARVNSTKSTDFDKLCEGIKIMYSRNDFADVLEEKSNDEEDEENENKEEKIIELNNYGNNGENRNKKNENDLIGNEPNIAIDENEEEKDYDGNDIIPDDEIDELFRKSCADLQKMRKEIKFMNESIDKNSKSDNNNTINTNQRYKEGKTKLNPVIVKKENNPNYIGNKRFFGNINQKKI